MWKKLFSGTTGRVLVVILGFLAGTWFLRILDKKGADPSRLVK